MTVATRTIVCEDWDFRIIQEFVKERDKQRKLFARKDDKEKSIEQWAMLIVAYLGQFVDERSEEYTEESRLYKIGALIMAMIEAGQP